MRLFMLFNAFLLLFFLPIVSYALDDENCLLCHKYRTLSRVDEKGKTRIYYINDTLFHSSVHGRVKCSECHSGITKIPHEENTTVNCLNECHIKEPTEEKRFSHKNVEAVILNSVHSKKYPFLNNPDSNFFPKCTDCHNNPLFKPIQIFKHITDEGQSPKALARCNLCHKDTKFIKYFYNHVSHRLHSSKDSKEIVRMCEKCHAKNDMLRKHKLKNAIATYKDTFHGKAIEFNYSGSPDCIDCHVKENESAHAIKSYRDVQSAVYEKERWKTCAKKGCHPDAKPALGTVRMHVVINKDLYPYEYYTALGFTILTLGAYFPLAILLILELIREIFPNLTFRRRRK